jgi:hypothetical protein
MSKNSEEGAKKLVYVCQQMSNKFIAGKNQNTITN